MGAADKLITKHVKEINDLDEELEELVAKCGEFEQQVHDIYAQAVEYKKLWKEQRRKAESFEKECKRLEKTVELKNKHIDRMGFCPDCRDKLDGQCYRCKVYRLERRLLIYGRHLEDCQFEGAYRITPHGGELAEVITPCTCGLLEQD